MQPSQPDLAAAPQEKSRASTGRKLLFSAIGAALLVLGLTQLDALPVLSLLLGILGLLAIGFGQVKTQPKAPLRQSLRAAAMVTARMDSIADNPPPSSVNPQVPEKPRLPEKAQVPPGPQAKSKTDR
jgi:hypothetical protein